MWRLLSGFALSAAATLAAAPANQGGGAMRMDFGAQGSVSVPMQIVVMLTLLTLLPAFVMSLTPFLRLSMVFHFLRQALGTQTVPSNQVLIGLSLFLSLLIMQPVVSEVIETAWDPMEKGDITAGQALENASKPLRGFLLRFAREKDIQLFVEITKSARPQSGADLDLKILMPAYILSELRAGFQIGAVIFLPFLIIDIVVSSVTITIGMMQLPPVMISAPFKLLLFVLVDGWNLIVGSLMKSFY